MTAVDWDSTTWGQAPGNVHHAAWSPDRHDTTEDAAEATQ